MRQYFATYQQSLRLKELGFDEVCLGIFFEPDRFCLEHEYCGGAYPLKTSSLYPENSHHIPAPLYTQAIKYVMSTLVDKEGHPQGGYGVRYFYDGGGQIFELGCNKKLLSFDNESECLDQLFRLTAKKQKQLVCRKDLVKSTYEGKAFTEGEFYDIVNMEDDLIWLLDNNKNQFSFSYEKQFPFYYIGDYFNY